MTVEGVFLHSPVKPFSRAPVSYTHLAAMPQMWIYYAVRITVTVITFIILIRFVSDATAQLLQKPTRSLLILGLMPLVYYVFDLSLIHIYVYKRQEKHGLGGLFQRK